VIIRPFHPPDKESIRTLVGTLHPKWFDAHALQNIPIDVEKYQTWVADEHGHLVGFVTLAQAEDGKWHIKWMAVSLHRQGNGIGKTLLNEAITHAKNAGVNELFVETVVEQDPPDGSYDRTIYFYKKHGFELHTRYHQETFHNFTFSKGLLHKYI